MSVSPFRRLASRPHPFPALCRLLVAGAVLLVAGSLTVAPAWGQYASDDASNSAYTDGDWVDGENGGSGFGSWNLKSDGSSSGHFVASSTGNGDGDDNGDNDIDTGGNALGLFAEDGQLSEAIRPFSPRLLVGERFEISFDNGFVETSGSIQPTVGFELRNGSSESLLEFFFVGGDMNYKIKDASGTFSTGLSFTDEGLTIDITLTSPTTYRISINKKGGGSATFDGKLINAPAGRAVQDFRVFNANAAAGLNSPNSEQDLYVNSFFGRSLVFNVSQAATEPNLQTAVNNAGAGETIAAGRATYNENVNVSQSVNLLGAWAGVPGSNGSRGTAEAMVDGGITTPVDQTSNIAFTIQDDDVTIDGFKLIGNQGVVLDPATVSNSPTNDGAGLTVQNNLVATDIVGVRIENVTTTGSKSFTVADNQFELARQSYDLVDLQEQTLGGNADNTEGDENFEYTASVAIRTIDGDQAPTIQNNVVTDDGDGNGSFYGYAIDDLNVSGPTTIAGDPGNTGTTGTIQGTAQGIAILDGQSTGQSNVVIEDFSISAMSGSAPNNSGVNFQAGVFSFTEDLRNGNTTVVHISNTTIEGLDFSDPQGASGANASANVYLGSFDFGDGGGGTAKQDVTVEGVTIQNTEHRGISWAGNAAQNITATITDDPSGDNTVVQGVAVGNDAHAIHSENGGSPTINNTDITNENISAADAIHVRDAGATVTIGPDVNIDTKGKTFLEDQNGRAATADLKVTSPTSLAEAEIDLDGSNGGTISLTGSETLSVANSLVLTGGTFDVSSGNLTLTSTSETSTAAIAGTGSGSITGDVTFERVLDKGDDADHFRFLSAPTATKIDDEGSGSNAGNLLSNTWTQSETGEGANSFGNASPSVFTYNEGATISSSLSEGWRGVGLKNNNNSGELNDLSEIPGQSNATLDPGRGVLAYLFTDRDLDGTDEGFPITLRAAGPVQPEEYDGNAITPPISFTANNSPTEDGWNLIANPFMAPIDWESIEANGADLTNVDNTIYVWDPSANSGNGAYATYTADTGPGGAGTQNQYIAPFQAFFVKATGDSPSPSIGGIDSGDKATGQSPEFKSTPGGKGPPTVQLRLQSEDGTWQENTGFRFTDSAAPGKDIYDAYQLKPLTSSYALVASEMDGTDALFDQQNLPVPPEQDTLNLSLDITESGTYTLGAGALDAMPDDWNVILVNTDTGARYDLGAGQAASFTYEPDTTSTSTSASRKTSASGPAARLEAVSPTVMRASSGPTAKASDGGLPSFRLLVGPDAELPVELAGFDGQTDEQHGVLNWRTASETNNAGFEVLHRRAADSSAASGGASFQKIGFVDGAGTTTEARRYRFRTDPLEIGTHVFRLRQLDTDGTAHLSEPVRLQVGLDGSHLLRVPYPNPFRRQATVEFAVRKPQEVTLALYNTLGQRVRTLYRGTPSPNELHDVTLDGRDLASGIYFLRLRGESVAATRRVAHVE